MKKLPRYNTLTSKDIAQLAGVSQSTVSAIFNNRLTNNRISKATRDKVLKIIKKTGFQPNPLGKSLVTGKSFLIGLLLPEVGSFMACEWVRAIEDFTQQRGYGIILNTTQWDPDREKDAIKFMLKKHVDGIIIKSEFTTAPEIISAVAEQNTPVAYLAYRPENPLPNSGLVCVDGESEGYLGINHLLEKGHQHIVCVDFSDWMKEGVEQAKEEHSQNSTIDYWQREDILGRKDFFRTRWHDLTPKPSAFFVNSDKIACKIMNMAIRSGLKIPQDLAIMGVDDIPEAKDAVVPLTSISQPKYDQGTIACQLLFDLLGNKPKQDVILQPELQIRNSTSLTG